MTHYCPRNQWPWQYISQLQTVSGPGHFFSISLSDLYPQWVLNHSPLLYPCPILSYFIPLCSVLSHSALFCTILSCVVWTCSVPFRLNEAVLSNTVLSDPAPSRLVRSRPAVACPSWLILHCYVLEPFPFWPVLFHPDSYSTVGCPVLHLSFPLCLAPSWPHILFCPNLVHLILSCPVLSHSAILVLSCSVLSHPAQYWPIPSSLALFCLRLSQSVLFISVPSGPILS